MLPSHGLVKYFKTRGRPKNKTSQDKIDKLFEFLDEVTKADPEANKKGLSIRICVRDDADGRLPRAQPGARGRRVRCLCL